MGLPIATTATFRAAICSGGGRRRTGAGEALTVQAYYDYSYRKVPLQFEGTKNTGEIDVQQQLDRGRHLIVVGGTARVTRDDDRGHCGLPLRSAGSGRLDRDRLRAGRVHDRAGSCLSHGWRQVRPQQLHGR